MNPVIEQLNKRKSIRAFTGEKVSDEDLETILNTALRCATSINGQQRSLIYVRDKELLKKISELCGGQKHIAQAEVFIFVIVDFNRTDYAVEQTGEKQVIHESAEGVLVGAVDAGIILNAIQTSAEALGYGTTAIGAVRNNPEAFIEMLNLPEKTFPIVGTTIGVPTNEAKNAPLKPRVALESIAFENSYDNKKVKEGVLEYEKELKNFRVVNNMNYLQSYCEQTASYYKNTYFRRITQNYKKQGFNFQD